MLSLLFICVCSTFVFILSYFFLPFFEIFLTVAKLSNEILSKSLKPVTSLYHDCISLVETTLKQVLLFRQACYVQVVKSLFQQLAIIGIVNRLVTRLKRFYTLIFVRFTRFNEL